MVTMRNLADFVADRMMWMRRSLIGDTFNGKRNLDFVFGYNPDPTIDEYVQRYERDGIAGRVVDSLPKATWRGGFELVENDDPKQPTEFETAWNSLAERFDISPLFERADVLSQHAHYSVLLIGAPGNLLDELPRGNGSPDAILYLKPYLGAGGPDLTSATQRVTTVFGQGMTRVRATIKEIETDASNERYGQPKIYTIRFDGTGGKDVHWSRVIHIAERTSEDDIYSAPALKRCWNLLDDLKKVTGGGAEAFYQRANQGRVWSIDKDLKDLKAGEKEEMADQIEKLKHDIVRDVRVRGVSVDTLDSDVADFAGPADTILTQIAGASTNPKRILTGSEMGELASSEDRDNWRDQVNGRRNQYAYPSIVKRFANRLITFNYLPAPKKAIQARWGAVMNLTETEKMNKAKSWAETKTNEGNVFANDEIRDVCYEMAPLSPEEKALLRPMPKVQLGPNGQPVAPTAPFAMPRAAAEAIDVLADAIEEGDEDLILEICGLRSAYSDDQLRDDDGKWTSDGATLKDVEKHLNKLLPGRKKLTIDALTSMSKDKLHQLHKAYSKAHELSTGAKKMSYAATKRFIEMQISEAVH